MEAALTLPFVLFLFVTILWFFPLQAIETKVQSALSVCGQKAAIEYYAVDSIAAADLISAVTVAAEVKEYLQNSDFPEAYVEDGIDGVSFSGTRYSEDKKTIFLVVKYRFRFPFFSLFGLSLPVVQKTAHRVWTGNPIEDHILTDRVFVTRTGTVYHLFASCPHLFRDVKEATLSRLAKKKNADGCAYTPCEICCPDGLSGNDTVYYTEGGERYHEKSDCAGIKRTVYEIPITDIKGRPLCKKCEEMKEKQ